MRSCFIMFLLSGITLQGIAQQDSISNRTWYRKINQAFGSIATGQSEAANLVNYGAFEPLNGQFKLNIFGPIGSIEKKQAPFFSANAGGKITSDNSAVLFNESKFNSGMNLGMKLHIPLFSEIHSSGNEIDTINRKISLLSIKRIRDSILAVEEFDGATIRTAFEQVRLRIVHNKSLLRANREDTARLSQRFRETPLSDTALRLRLLDTLLMQSGKRKNLYADSLNLQAESERLQQWTNSESDRQNQINRLNQEGSDRYKALRDTLERSVTISDKQFTWLTLVGNIERKKYYSFYDTALFPGQLIEKKITAYQFGIEINFIGFDKNLSSIAGSLPHVHVGNIGLLRIQTNDMDDWTTTEMSDSRKYTSHDSTHTLATKYNVYTNAITSYKAWKLYANYYYYFGKKSNFAVHIFPDIELRDTHQQPVNVGAGLVLGIKNKKDNTVLAVELYGKLKDIGKSLVQEEAKFYNRNSIGLNIGIPLSFPTIK